MFENLKALQLFEEGTDGTVFHSSVLLKEGLMILDYLKKAIGIFLWSTLRKDSATMVLFQKVLLLDNLLQSNGEKNSIGIIKLKLDDGVSGIICIIDEV